MIMKRILKGDFWAVSPVIAVILMVAITVVRASVLYVYVNSLVDTSEEVETFGLLDIEIRDSSKGDYMRIKLIDGDPFNWSAYKIIITNSSDENQIATMLELTGDMEIGSWMKFNNANAKGFGHINYEQDTHYNLEIYHIQKSKRVYHEKYILCQAG